MIELIVFGLILFIVAVGATILYDKHKEVQANRPPKVNLGRPATVRQPPKRTLPETTQQSIDRLTKSLQDAQKKAVKVTVKKNKAQQDLEDMFLEDFLKSRHTKGKVADQTITVEELIAQIERIRDRK